MSYQEKNITVSLVSYLLILGYFLQKIFQIFQQEPVSPNRVFSLWVTVIIATIIVNIIASIVTNIVLSIVHAIRTQSAESPRFIADERDRLIDLKGNKTAYITFSIGVFLAMLSYVLGQPPLVMFSLVVFFSIVGELAGGIAQISLYRRGL
jgi:DMSO reductase anchor subunit